MSTRYATRGVVAAVALVAATTLPACTAEPAPAPSAVGNEPAVTYEAPSAHRLDPQKLARIVQELPPSSPQRPLLQDGTVSHADLALSWTRLRSCVESGGLVVKGPFINPITTTEYLYTYARPGRTSTGTPTTPGRAPAGTGGASDDDIVRRCEERFWIPLSSVYSANTPQRMDGRLAGFMSECMAQAHFPTTGARTFDQLVRDREGTVTAARLRQANACLDRGVLRLFPGLPYFPRP